VEFFVKPKPDKGYLISNLIAAGHYFVAILPTRKDERGLQRICICSGRGGAVRHNQSFIAGCRRPGNCRLCDMDAGILHPLKLLENYVGSFGNVRGSEWKANFYKCGE